MSDAQNGAGNAHGTRGTTSWLQDYAAEQERKLREEKERDAKREVSR